MNENYEPSHFLLTDEPGSDVIYFDFLIVRKDGLTWQFAAWGDGAHVNEVAVIGLENAPLKPLSNCAHTMQMEPFFRSADSLIAIRNHEVVYKKGV